MNSLFVYGTLREPYIAEHVVGHAVEYVSDVVLKDFVRVKNGYYAIHPSPDNEVVGHLILNLSEDDFKNLDRYESVDTGLYTRRTVTINNNPVEVYVGGKWFADSDHA